MSRLIDGDALIDNIKTFRCIDCERRNGMKNGKLKFVYEIGDAPCRACDVADMIDTIDEAPTVDAAPVVHGRWVMDEYPHDGDVRCSACLIAVDQMHERNHGLLNIITGGEWQMFYRYCPHCGAKMDLEGR